jgi:hypothetical protein
MKTSSARRSFVAALAVVVTASVATVTGVSAAAERPAHLSTAAAVAANNWNNTAVTPLSRRNGFTDIVYVGAQGRIHADTRFPDTNDWFPQYLNRGEAAPDTKVTGVSRYAGRLDVFAIGTDRNVWTAYLDEDVDGRGSLTWHGWFELPGLKVDRGSSVHVVASSRDTMDLFSINEDGRPYTIRWTAQDDWGTWRRLDNSDENFIAGFGAEVTAVAVGRDIHVFSGRAVYGRFQGTNIVYTKRFVGGQWSRWEEMNPDTAVTAGSEVVPVRRRVTSTAIDLFVVTPDPVQSAEPQGLSTATWNGESWSLFTPLLDRSPRHFTTVSGVSRERRNVDVFMVDEDRSVMTAAWNAADGWHGWWPLGGVVGLNSSVGAFSDGVGDLQIFVHGDDMNAVFPIWTRRWSSASGWGAWENVVP